jgi:hypothetical protein
LRLHLPSTPPPCGFAALTAKPNWLHWPCRRPAPPPDRGRGAGIHPVRPRSTPGSALAARRWRRDCVRSYRQAGSRRSCRRASGVGGSAQSQATAGPREFGCAHLCWRRVGRTHLSELGRREAQRAGQGEHGSPAAGET